ncbi:zinc ion transmembrane transporter [Fragilaria crotonensis]|nr:zinc ion transmembrane transporter [Fragilaria crotonensis]
MIQLLISFLLVGTTVAFGGGKALMGLSFEQITYFVKPVYYYLELQVASKSIPNVSKILDRKKLQDYPFDVATLTFDHSKWDSVLKRHVKVGAGSAGAVSGINLVDYDGVKADDDFCQYLSQLEQANVQQMQPAEQLAFWMNAYNALCINIIIQHETKNSIQIESITELSNQMILCGIKSLARWPVWISH